MTSPDLLRRVQARFLRELFRAGRSGFALKGGMALAALYPSARLTQDIDLDFPPLGTRTAESLHNQVRKALEIALRGSAIKDVKIHEPGRAEVSPKWKVAGHAPDGAPFHLKIEVSRRPPPPGRVRQVPLAGVASLGLGTFFVDLYDAPTLGAMKIAALLSPVRHAPRDVFDLDLLLPAHQPTPEGLQWALDHAGLTPEGASEMVKEKLAAMPWDLFATQVRPSLDPEVATRFDAEAWQAMRNRVATAVTELLAAQAERAGGAP